MAHRRRASRGRGRAAGVILGARDQLRRHLRRASSTAAGEIRSNVIASQGLLHARYGGVVPEVASRRHLELIDAVTADALERRGRRRSTTIEPVAVTRGPGLIGALLVGVSSAKALAAARGLPLAPVDHLHGHVVASTLRRRPDRAAVPLPGGQRRAHVPRPGGRPARATTVLGQTLDDAAGEAFDKGARLLGPAATPAAPSSTGWRARATRRRSTSRARLPGEARLLLQRPEDRAALRGPRPRRGGGRAPAGRPGRLLPARDRRRAGGPHARRRSSARGSSGWPSAAAWRPTRELRARAARASWACRVWIPPLELCTDNAAMIAGGRPLHRAAAPTPTTWRSTRRRGCVHDRVTLYGKPGCHLCDEATRGGRRPCGPSVGSSSRRSTSRSIPALQPRYGERIPVVEVDGEEVVRAAASTPPRCANALGRVGAVSFREPIGAAPPAVDGDSPERLSLGVAARLSRYLQVLTQAKKMGKETISSQELADYTHVNSTQIRRDLSGFGKFGKRGVGYNVDSLRLADPQDPAHQRPAQHRAVRRRPPGPGDRRLGHLRRPRLPGRGDLRHRPEQGRQAR